MKRQEAYSALELTEQATEEDIKKAFKKAAIKYHPDRNQDNKEQAETDFKKVNQAFQILTGKEKAEDEQPQGFSPFGGSGFDGPFGGAVNINDFIADFFGTRSGFPNMNGDIFNNAGVSHQQINHISTSIKLTFEESVLGCTKNVKYNRTVFCKTCKGNGDVISNEACSVCKGVGFATKRVNLGNNFTRMQSVPCQACQGKRKTSTKCTECLGAAGKQEEISLNIKVPAIGQNVTSLVIRGKGNVLGDMASNCILQVYPTSEGSDDFAGYRIQENDIFVTKKVQFDKLMFGGDFDIKLVNNTIDKINIKELSDVGTKVVLKGKGVQGTITGDMIVILDLEMPKKQIDKDKIDEIKQIIEKIYQENNG